MVSWCKMIGLALLFGGAFVSRELAAATSSTLQILPTELAGETADSVEVGRIAPIVRTNREAARPQPSGNSLWSIPLSTLSATQERPIFSASRRPPQRAVVALPVEQVVAPTIRVAGPEPVALALIGTVVGGNEAIAVFLDRTSQKIVRLRQGETHAGWVLDSVEAREVTLKKADQIETLGMQREETPAPSAIVPIPASTAAPPVASGGFDTPYAPFIPRSTPKNGESDGL